MRLGGRAAGRATVRRAGAALAVALAVAGPAARLAAQDTTRVGPAAAAGGAGRVGPLGAFWRSFLLPGWGQAVNDRHVVGALFVAWEGVSAMMTLKVSGEVAYLREIESPLLDSKRQELEDWIVVWVFNHLFAGAEAFVSSHLRDFPPDLRLRALPGGVAVALPLPRW